MYNNEQCDLIFQLPCKDDELRKLKKKDIEDDPEVGQFDQQQGSSTSGPLPVPGESFGKERFLHKSSTESQPAGMLKVKTIVFVDEEGLIQSQVNADKIEDRDFVEHCLTKEQISMLFNIIKEHVDDLVKKEDMKVEDEVKDGVEHIIPSNNTYYDQARWKM